MKRLIGQLLDRLGYEICDWCDRRFWNRERDSYVPVCEDCFERVRNRRSAPPGPTVINRGTAVHEQKFDELVAKAFYNLRRQGRIR